VNVTVSESPYSSLTAGVPAPSVCVHKKLPIAAAPPSLALPVNVTWLRERTVTVTGSAPAAEVGSSPTTWATATGGCAEEL